MTVSQEVAYRDESGRRVLVLHPLTADLSEMFQNPGQPQPQPVFLARVVLTAQGRAPNGQMMQAQHPVEAPIQATNVQEAFEKFDQAVKDFIEKKQAESRRILVPKNRINGGA